MKEMKEQQSSEVSNLLQRKVVEYLGVKRL